MAQLIPNSKEEMDILTPEMLGIHTIKAKYTCAMKDSLGNDVVFDLEDETDIFIGGPNLRSTETDGRHLFFRTSDGKLLKHKG